MCIFLFLNCEAQSDKNKNKHYDDVTPDQSQAVGELLIKAAEKHLGKPYLAHTLDKTLEEKIVVRMDGFDCTTLIETVLAQVKSKDDVKSHVQKTRYRNGIIEDYASRIHYFTEWIYENEKNGIVTDVTSSIKYSKPYSFTANYMSRNRSKYIQLKNDDIQLNKIKAMQDRINQYKWNYIPKSEVNKCYNSINNGDIIVITTNIPGLETSHLGFAYKKDQQIHLLHASLDEKKVVITTKSLQQYLMNNPKQTGIMVVRVNE
jgi:hypothetical protein